mmetsp:Transcript_21195/g.32009  ORF Transcript_21195/g.32009 Transcript_21195/m.32009 type:complete len:121 (+) Transcript_21195:211-573(+)
MLKQTHSLVENNGFKKFPDIPVAAVIHTLTLKGKQSPLDTNHAFSKKRTYQPSKSTSQLEIIGQKRQCHLSTGLYTNVVYKASTNNDNTQLVNNILPTNARMSIALTNIIPLCAQGATQI